MKAGIYNMDCMKAMREFPDKFFELAIVDPPYGIGNCISSKRKHKYKKMEWNNKIPTLEYFNELYRISINQIIWGANYYQNNIHHVGRIVHDKTDAGRFNLPITLSEGDIASQSFNKLIKIFRYCWNGNRQGGKINWDNSGPDGRIHPTQKPIQLYKWLLMNYAKEGDKILDTHLGSGSSAIAAHRLGFEFWGFEIDKDYYDAAIKRINLEKTIKQLFA